MKQRARQRRKGNASPSGATAGGAAGARGSLGSGTVAGRSSPDAADGRSGLDAARRNTGAGMLPADGEKIPFALWQNLRARLVWIYEGPPQSAQGPAVRLAFTAWYLHEGQVNLRFADSPAIVAGRGSWILLPPGSDERSFSADAKILSVFFDAQWNTGSNWLDLSTPLLFLPHQTTGWYRAALPMLKIVRRDFAAAYNGLPAAPASFLQYAQLQGHFLTWLNALVTGAAAAGVGTHPLLVEDDRALRIREYLDTYPLQRPLRIEQLAEAFHLSVSQLGRVYFAHFGHSPRDYFDERRLMRAVTLLRESDAPVKEIAFSLGFRHTSQLSSWFRGKTGSSPMQYRAARCGAVGAPGRTQAALSLTLL